MTDILNSAPDSDKSIGFFNDILGVGWQNILDGQSSVGGAGATIFEIFSSFNAAILVSVLAFGFFVVSSGIVGTAHEGEALGKRYSTLWTPLRMVAAISMLLPLPWAKLSLLQALILKCIFLSIGGADYLTVKAVDFMASRSGAISTPQAKLPYVEKIGEEILVNLVVQQYFKEREEGLATDGVYAKEATGIKSFTFVPPVGGDGGIMGKFKISCIDGVQSADLCDAELNASVALVDGLRPVAQAIVSQWSGGSDTPLDDTQTTAYRSALSSYVLASQQAETAALAEVGTNADLDQFKQSVKNNGWAWLGVYYWKIAKFNEIAEAKTQVKLMVSSALDEEKIAELAGPEILTSLERYHKFADKIAAGRIEQRSLGDLSGDGVGMGSALASLWHDAIGSSFGDNTALTGAARLLADALASGEPVSHLQQFGHRLVNSGSFIGTFGLIGGGAGKIIGLVERSPLGASFVPKGLSVAGRVAEKAGGAMVTIAGFLIGAGVFLAYYLPSLPFIIWTSAVVGWLILSFELLVAASLWAAVHAVPEGEGMAGQQARAGYMIFFGVLMRPSLYVIGFFISFVLVGVVGHFIGEAYLDFTTANAADDLPFGPVAQIVGWLATVIIGCGLSIYSIHKTFSLVTFLPDEIAKRIGAGSFGDGGSEQKTGAAFSSGMSTVGGGVSGAVSGGGAGAGAAAASAVTPKAPGALTESLSTGDKQ